MRVARRGPGTRRASPRPSCARCSRASRASTPSASRRAPPNSRRARSRSRRRWRPSTSRSRWSTSPPSRGPTRPGGSRRCAPRLDVPTRATSRCPAWRRCASTPTSSPTRVAVLGDAPVAVASVATAFPSGRASLRGQAARRGRGRRRGRRRDRHGHRPRRVPRRVDWGQVFDEVVAVKAACGDAHLKVILETGELVTYDNVRRASWIAMLGGADFIKTSTGKVGVNATPPVALVMLEAVRDFAETDRSPGGGQGGRWHPHHQGRAAVPGGRQRDGRARRGSLRSASASAPRRCSTTC